MAHTISARTRLGGGAARTAAAAPLYSLLAVGSEDSATIYR